ncbi:CE1759 family FMN reductase [Actinomadura sp. WAC 06369]|uniref:CE1759 family FMN reductase n=1 Tax=Actinomadura sp. WAC 06369 TaxID=2203193 RepID=UPI000F766DD6|nr:CE1759 family FMN reductase [Actinomadura sp. WAC 06369]RSN66913.1 NADPH-dependent FMN reductase [Actinomadura sp. WAC 06369]
MSGPRTLAVVSAGLGRPSSTRLLADRLAGAAADALRAEHGADVVIEPVELRDHAHAMVDAALTGFPSGDFRAAVETVTGADGLVAVTPVFNASYGGLFKTFFDVLDRDALDGTPALIGATGGTERHSLALDFAVRPLLAYLRANVVPTAVYAASADWGSGDGRLGDRVRRAGAELAALVAGRPAPAAEDPYDNPVPFETLLGSPDRAG